MAEPTENRKIIIPIDSSGNSDRAFEWYCANLRREIDTVVFVHIVEPQFATSAISVSDTITFKLDDVNSKMETASKKSKDLLQKYLKAADEIGLSALGVINVDTKAGEAIVKVALENKADFVVIGNRGIGAIKRTFLGSTSDFIMHHVNIPVIVVPPPK